jgi:hypothetical protein
VPLVPPTALTQRFRGWSADREEGPELDQGEIQFLDDEVIRDEKLDARFQDCLDEALQHDAHPLVPEDDAEDELGVAEEAAGALTGVDAEVAQAQVLGGVPAGNAG